MRWIIGAFIALVCATPVWADWYKGNTHAHTYWSDGKAAPEVVAAWFKDHGYQFLSLSDHHILQEGERFVSINDNGDCTPAMVEDLRARFGKDWVETSMSEYGTPRMRLKTLPELQARFDEPGHFLLIPGEELTTLSGNPHMVALNIREPIPGSRGRDAVKSIKQYMSQVAEQQARFGVPMLIHLNHPNWSNGITAEMMLQIPDLRYFEIKNAQASVKSDGYPEEHKPPVGRLWDIVLSLRLAKDPGYRLYGFGTDDCHIYYEMGGALNNPGRAWTMVRAPELSWSALCAAFAKGDFYASTGVTLDDVRSTAEGLAIAIAVEPGVTYTTRFFGTRRGFDPASTPVLDDKGKPLRGVTQHYSDAIGQLLLESTETSPAYTFQGDELYVRAVVTASRDEENPIVPGTKARAWTQPCVAVAAP